MVSLILKPIPLKKGFSTFQHSTIPLFHYTRQKLSHRQNTIIFNKLYNFREVNYVPFLRSLYTSSEGSPWIRTVFSLDRSPEVISTPPFGNPNLLAINSFSALLALPSTGGAVSFTLKTPFSSQIIRFIEDLGNTFTSITVLQWSSFPTVSILSNYLQQFSLWPLGLANAGLWGLFLKAARQIFPHLVERPRGFE